MKVIEEHGKQLCESNALVKKIMTMKNITKINKFVMNLVMKG